jgi:hypothetical protein
MRNGVDMRSAGAVKLAERRQADSTAEPEIVSRGYSLGLELS